MQYLFPQVETFLLEGNRVAYRELMKLTKLRKIIKLTRHRSLPKNAKGSISPSPEISSIAIMFSRRKQLS